MHFERIFLADKSNQLVSEWWGEVERDESRSAARLNDTETVFLPPMKPETLKINIELKVVEGGSNHDHEELASQLKDCLIDGSEFWDHLLYKVQLSAGGKGLCLELTCQVWNWEKVSTLLQKPAENRGHMKSLPQVCFLKGIKIYGSLLACCKPSLLIDQLVPQFNEYFGSLFVSQLEFRFPFVFSTIARKRFLSQETALGPISYALSNSSCLLPILTKLIADDKTATTVYQMIKYNRSRTSQTSFQIAKQRQHE